MLFSRWKLITGALGLSIGGFATFNVRADKPSELPPPPSVLPATPVAALPVLPPVPATTPAPATPMTLPPTPVVLPSLPLPDAKPTETKLPPVPPKTSKPMDIPVVPASGVALPPMPAEVLPPPSVPATPSVATPTKPVAITPVEPTLPPPTEFSTPRPSSPPADFVPPSLPPMPKPTPPVSNLLPPADPAPTRPAAAIVPSTVPSKFRIVLRVGAGDPSFEVRLEDDLVMKVVCEKVDIKSPEKGQGPSNVTATGKVRFVGFGAEGTCDSFSFLAGTGEVALSGNVNVKVRDKIGRVESELHAEKMQYKLDPTALAGVLKP